MELLWRRFSRYYVTKVSYLGPMITTHTTTLTGGLYIIIMYIYTQTPSAEEGHKMRLKAPVTSSLSWFDVKI